MAVDRPSDRSDRRGRPEQLAGEVATEFVFHCEDDWEFSAGGFLERSFSVLDSNPGVLHVGLRAPTDLNGHPVTRHVFDADGVPYRLLEHSWHAGDWGNVARDSPSIRAFRRLRDYRLLDPSLPSIPPAP